MIRIINCRQKYHQLSASMEKQKIERERWKQRQSEREREVCIDGEICDRARETEIETQRERKSTEESKRQAE